MKRVFILILLVVLVSSLAGFRVRSFVGKQDRQTQEFLGKISSLRNDSLWVKGKVNGKRIYKFSIDMFTVIKGDIEEGDDVIVFYYVKKTFRDTIKVAKKIVLVKKGEPEQVPAQKK
jgi:hypothetical protein